MTSDAAGEARAWGWVGHLRAGGTTPWSRWRDPAPADARRSGSGRYLPGAQQLELVRRLNLVGSPTPVLVERVLGASAPGRGQPDLGLVGARATSPFGAAPVDPAALPPAELVRVATSLIAEDVVRAGEPPPPRGPRRFRRRYRLLGDPELARPVREALVADGRPPGGPGATTVVLGTDLATMLVHVWTARAFGAGVRPWRDWIAAEMRRPELLPRIDLAAIAHDVSRVNGPSRVHVVLDDPHRAAQLAGGRRVRPELLRLSADSIELGRRAAPVVAMLVPPERRSHLMWDRLRPLLAAADDGPSLCVPHRHLRRLAEHTDALRRRLADADYAVHGDLPDPTGDAGVSAPDEERVLAVATRLLLEAPTAGSGPDAWPPGAAAARPGAEEAATTTEAGDET